MYFKCAMDDEPVVSKGIQSVWFASNSSFIASIYIKNAASKFIA